VKDLSDIAISAVAAAVQDLMEQEPKEAPFELGAPWTHHANPEELERLAKLHSRIQRKQRALSALIGERKTIMDRCIRRQRRTQGKN
jgi:ribosomal protein L10